MRITIIDNSTGKSYSPRPQTIINYFGQGYSASLGDIIDLAMDKFYSKRCFFWRDNGLFDQGIFGQVCRAVKNGEATCVTPRIQLTININGHDVISDYEFFKALGE